MVDELTIDDISGKAKVYTKAITPATGEEIAGSFAQFILVESQSSRGG